MSQNKSIRNRELDGERERERRGVREGVTTAKPCWIPHLWSAGKLRMNPLILYYRLVSKWIIN